MKELLEQFHFDRLEEEAQAQQVSKLLLAGTEFTIDVENEWIFETANPSNYIPFSALEEDGRSFRLVYDPKTKNAYTGDEDEMLERTDLQYVALKELRWMPAFGYVWNPGETKLDLNNGKKR